jgi:hypothetical protein
MKKQVLKALVVLTVVGSASAAMATQTINGTVTIGAGNTFSPSTKVVISVASIATSYTACSAHLNGTKEYATVGGTGITGTNTDPSKIYARDYTTTAGSTVATPSAMPTSATVLNPDDTSWK